MISITSQVMGVSRKRPATRVHRVAPDRRVIYMFSKLDPQSPTIKNMRNLVHAFLR